MVTKIISGGQTGADQIGLLVGKKLGYETGGTAPKFYKTENGSDYSLRDKYGLVEDDSEDYDPRTRKNILDSDGTVVFGDIKSPGSKNTMKYCKAYGKPSIDNPDEFELKIWLEVNEIEVLNVAGNRGSKLSPFKSRGVERVLTAVLRKAA